MKEQLSKCCKASVLPTDYGTGSFYLCAKCSYSCDLDSEMKEQVSIDPVILGYDIGEPNGDISVVVIEYKEYDRLKRLEENVKKANAELDKEIAQIESGESLTNVLDDDYFTLKDKKRLLESLDK